MQELYLDDEAVKGDPELASLLGAFRGETEGVYTTLVRAEEGLENLYQFITTSKDAHIALGKLSEARRIKLAQYLREYYSRGPSYFLFSYKEFKDSRSRKGRLLVTVTKEAGGSLTFHLDPVHSGH